MKIAADSNVILRFLLNDDQKQAEKARLALTKAEWVAIPLPVLCEVVWTLSRGYKLAADDIAAALTTLLNAANVHTNRSAVAAGLQMLLAGGDFADGVIAHEGQTLGGEVFVSFDKQAVKLLNKQGDIKAKLL